MTYDTFFKHIFDAEKYPERLSEMLSAIIGKKLLVKRALPLEHMQISDKGSLLVLDIIVEFETGVKLELLQEFFFIPLDIIFAIKHNEDEGRINNDLEAWLYFIASDRPEDILKVINYHPRFAELYRDICEFRMHPEVAIMMFSEALRRLDENTVQYMIEEQKKELELLKKETIEQQKLLENEKLLVEEQGLKLEEQGLKLKEQKNLLDEKDKEIEKLRLMLAEKE